MSTVITNFDQKRALFRQLGKAKAPERGGESDENPATSNSPQEQTVSPPCMSPLEQTAPPADGNPTDDRSTTDKRRQEAAAAGAKLIASMFDPFRDENGSFFINHGGNAIGLESTQGSDIIRMAAYESSKRGISEDMLKLVRTILRQAARARDIRPTPVRIGKVVDDDGGTSYLLDLGDADHRCVRVDPQGVQIVTAKSLGVAFQRGQGFAELPDPIMPADAAGAWRAVQPLLQGLAECDHLPLIAAKVEHLRCDSPHHILAFLGPPGSGKTTLARSCVMTIDPFKGEAPSVATEADAITAACQGRHSLLIDNIGGAIGAEIENLLCTSSYGSATTVREYYTTANSLTLKLHAAIHLTGVVPFLRQDDTLDRTLVVRVSKPSAYKSESAVRVEFAQQHPFVLGGLLWFLAERMRSAPTIEVQRPIKHRMYDFAVTGEAIAQALGVAPGEFIAGQAAARANGARDSIEGDGFAAPLVAWLQDTGKRAQVVSALPPKNTWAKVLPWEGMLNGRAVIITTAKDICEALRQRQSFDRPEPPRTARATTGAIDRVHGLLTKAGWKVEHVQWNGGSNKAWVFGAPR